MCFRGNKWFPGLKFNRHLPRTASSWRRWRDMCCISIARWHRTASDPAVVREKKKGMWWRDGRKSIDLNVTQFDLKADLIHVHSFCLHVSSLTSRHRTWHTKLFLWGHVKKKPSFFLHRRLRGGDGWHGCAMLAQWKRSDGECVWYDVSLRTRAASVPSVHWLITLLLVKAILSGGEVMAQQRSASGAQWQEAGSGGIRGDWTWRVLAALFGFFFLTHKILYPSS